MAPLTKGAVFVSSILFSLGIAASGCDDPPEAPSPEIQVGPEAKKLRQQVEETSKKAKKRIADTASVVDETDAGGRDASSNR